MEEWQIDSTFYLLDTLYIHRPQMKGTFVVASIMNNKGKTINLPISKDGKTYVITRGLFESIASNSHGFTIKELDKEMNWEYIVYRRLTIEPLMIKKP